MFREKNVEFMIKPTAQKMVFQIRASNVVPGVNPKICQFSVSFSDFNGEETERKVVLTISFNENLMINGISAKDLTENEKVFSISEFKLF